MRICDSQKRKNQTRSLVFNRVSENVGRIGVCGGREGDGVGTTLVVEALSCELGGEDWGGVWEGRDDEGNEVGG